MFRAAPLRSAVPCRSAIESLEPRRLLSGQMFAGAGPVVGKNARTVVAADFNGDGNLDLATPHSASPIVVSLGDGAGGFSTAPFSVGTNATGYTATTGDFNRDGYADLVYNPTTGSSVYVLLGSAAGTFTTAGNFGIGGTSVSFAAGDFNADGKLDLVTANNSGTVSVLLGKGDGTLGTRTDYAAGTTPYGVTTGDFNRDGRLDLAVANSSASGTVSVLLGDSSGAFGVASTVAVGSQPRSVITGDFNGDGKADLATANYSGNTVSVLIGNGDGTFAAATSTAVGANPMTVATADFDGDGKADLAVTNSGSNNVSILTGDSHGAFNVTATVAVGATPYGLAVPDLNHDGRPDLAVTNYGGYADSLFLNSGTGTFAPPPATAATGATPNAAVAGDFNNDGKADLAVTNSGSNTVSLLPGNGDGTFAAATLLTVGTSPYAVVTGDFNADGKPDLATANYGSNSVSVLLGNGDGTFAAAASVAVGATPKALVAGDFNNDGRTDLAVTNSGTTTVSILLRTAAGSFTSSTVSVAYYQPSAITAADFNNDGNIDLAVASSESYLSGGGALATLLNNGVGKFTQTSSLNISGGYSSDPTFVPYHMVAADFNNDGKIDVACTSPFDIILQAYYGIGDGSFSTLLTSGRIDGPAAGIAAADFDGDGKADLAAATYSSSTRGSISMIQNADAYGFAISNAIAMPVISQAVVAADFNGDGKPDIAAVNPLANSVTTLLNQRPDRPGVTAANGVLTVSGTDAVSIGETNGVFSITTPAGTERRLAAAITGLVVSGVNVAVNSDLGRSGGNSQLGLTVAAGGSVRLNTAQHLAGLTVNGTASVAAGGGKLLATHALGIDPAGTLDLNDNDLIYDYTGPTAQADAVRQWIAAARGTAGTWAGYGLTSTAAKNNAGHITTLGYLEASDFKTIYGGAAAFDGEPLDSTAVLVKYTLYGDSDFDGGVSINDFNRLSSHFGATGQNWLSGDYDGDAGVSINDFNLLAANFGKTLASAADTPSLAASLAVPQVVAAAQAVSLSGLAFNDNNKNGQYDKGDTAAAGKTVWLDLDDDGTKDANEPTAVTGKDGRYTFKHLAAGRYHVRQAFPKGYQGNTAARTVTLTAGKTATGVNLAR